MADVLAHPDPLRRQWGHWQFKPATSCLVYEHGVTWYEIDLETCNSSAAILDWIFQLQQKTWMTAHDMRDLLTALQDILHPQANYVHSGSRTPTGRQLARDYTHKLSSCAS